MHEFKRKNTKSLVLYERNARTHSREQVRQIAESIKKFGFTNPVLIDEQDRVIAGHGRLLAATELGLLEVPCIVVSGLSDAERRTLILADNKLALNAGWDDELLAAELRDLQDAGLDLSLTGFSLEELDDLLVEKKEERNPNEAPPVPDAPQTRLGDVFELGAHRLICGSVSGDGVLERLMGRELADIVWTDPPYNVAYGDKAEALQKYDKGHRNTSRILNDDMPDDDFAKFLAEFYKATIARMKPGAAIYVAHSETERTNFTSEFLRAGFKLSACIIWKKDSLVLGRSDYQWQHEPILYGWKPGSAHRWYGGRKLTSFIEVAECGAPFEKMPDGRWRIQLGDQVLIVDGAAEVESLVSSVMEVPRPKRSDLHPTMKPVSLIERNLRNNARQGDIVLDPFGGSGSTLMAADRLGMCARLVELSPGYCDVIVKRWEDYSGRVARKLKA